MEPAARPVPGLPGEDDHHGIAPADGLPAGRVGPLDEMAFGRAAEGAVTAIELRALTLFGRRSPLSGRRIPRFTPRLRRGPTGQPAGQSEQHRHGHDDRAATRIAGPHLHAPLRTTNRQSAAAQPSPAPAPAPNRKRTVSRCLRYSGRAGRATPASAVVQHGAGALTGDASPGSAVGRRAERCVVDHASSRIGL